MVSRQLRILPVTSALLVADAAFSLALLSERPVEREPCPDGLQKARCSEFVYRLRQSAVFSPMVMVL